MAAIAAGYRMKLPETCENDPMAQEVYQDLILQCWQYHDEDRPQFNDCYNVLCGILKKEAEELPKEFPNDMTRFSGSSSADSIPDKFDSSAGSDEVHGVGFNLSACRVGTANAPPCQLASPSPEEAMDISLTEMLACRSPSAFFCSAKLARRSSSESEPAWSLLDDAAFCPALVAVLPSMPVLS